MKRLKKTICFIANLSLLLNNFLPLIIFIKPAYAVEETPSEVVQETPTPEPSPIIENNQPIETTPTPETSPTPEITPEATVTPETIPIITPTIIEPIPTAEATPTAEITPNESTPTPSVVQPTETAPQTNETNSSDPAPTASLSITPELTPTVTPTPTNIAVPSPVLPIEGEIKTNVIQNEVTRTDLLNPNLSTDKPDYHPTEIAVISGYGFLPNTKYFLHITSDGIDQTYQINSDNNGNFTYSYQLDNVYRPQYYVEAKNQSGQLIDSMTFTDSRWVTLASVNDCLLTLVSPGEKIKAKVTVTTWNGVLDWNDDWKSTQYTIEGKPPVCVNTANHTNTGIHEESFTIDAPFTYGNYNVTFEAFSNDNCTGGFINTPLTLLGAISVVDKIAPKVSLISYPETLTQNRSANFTFSSDEPSLFECKLDNGFYLPCKNSKDYSYLIDGVHTFSVRAIDSWLNISQPVSYTWTVDNTGPVITLNDYNKNFTNQDIDVIASISDGQFITDSSHLFTENGSFEFQAKDTLGNISSLAVTINNIDKLSPVINLSTTPQNPDGDNNWYRTQPEISATATDINLSEFVYQWDSNTGDWSKYLTSFKIPSEGIHTLYLRATDLAGNITDFSQEFKWDQNDPESGAQNISANPNPTSGSTSKIKWEFAKDSIGIDRYEIKWKLNDVNNPPEYSKTVGAGTTEVEIDQLTEGRWTVNVIAFDQSGRSKANAIDVRVDRSAPLSPTLSITNKGIGSVTLAWNAIEDAVDYIIWYGSVQGIHNFGARVGNLTSYIVKGLGSGNYYFIVKAVDSAQNQSSDSNEVSTGQIIGNPGVSIDQPAEGFSPEVKGESTEEPSPNNNPILGISSDENNYNWWWLLLFLIPAFFAGRKLTKKKK